MTTTTTAEEVVAAAAVESPNNAQADGDEPVELSEAYVHSLASLGLERLQDEPGRLHAEAEDVDEVRWLLGERGMFSPDGSRT